MTTNRESNHEQGRDVCLKGLGVRFREKEWGAHNVPRNQKNRQGRSKKKKTEIQSADTQPLPGLWPRRPAGISASFQMCQKSVFRGMAAEGEIPAS